MVKSLVSVVIPIYNVEKYLDRCLRSVVNQTYKNLEIILVDDGSLDNCPKLCDEWAKKDNRIKVIHKKNAGLGMARNTGIENASGEYICFFDSDDYIAPETIEKTYRAAHDNNADIVMFGFKKEDAFGKIISETVPEAEKWVYSGKEVQDELLPDFISPAYEAKVKNTWISAWSLIYSMKLINETGWRFVSEREIISEDLYSLIMLYKYIDKAVILPEALYYYCENQSSLTHAYRPDRMDRILDFYSKARKLCEECKYNEKARQRLSDPFISFTIACIKMEVAAKKQNGFLKTYKRISQILNNEVLHCALKEYPLRQYKLKRKIFQYCMRKKYTLLVMSACKAG